jgi:hypothetical protein
LAAGLTACGGEASLLLDRSEYLPGEEVELLLRNESLQSLSHGPLECIPMEASEGAGWVEVTWPEGQGRYCFMAVGSLAGLAETTARVTLPTPLPPGTYRFRTTVAWDGARERVHSPGFEVRTAATP